MNSRTRILTTLEHSEPDCVPLDLGSTHISSIHKNAYLNLSEYLGINEPEDELVISDEVQQLVAPSETVLDRLNVDTRGLFPLCSHNWNINKHSRADGTFFIDEWGLTQFMPKENGHWWSVIDSSLIGENISIKNINDHNWPVAELKKRFVGLREQAIKHRENNKIVVMKGLCAGIFEMGQRLRGMEDFMMDLMTEPKKAGAIIDKITELKLKFWEAALDELGDVVDIVLEADDYGTQVSQLISPTMFREIFKPRYKNIFSLIKQKFQQKKNNNEKGYILFHSCGNIRPLMSDYIEIGVDILNPVHITAEGMNPKELKRDFGNDICFWGGGVDTQGVLPNGTKNEIETNVRENLDALMPGGGFVFNTVHNIQAEIAPENIMTMYNTLAKYGKY